MIKDTKISFYTWSYTRYHLGFAGAWLWCHGAIVGHLLESIMPYRILTGQPVISIHLYVCSLVYLSVYLSVI
jgi:hypothetical protein